MSDGSGTGRGRSAPVALLRPATPRSPTGGCDRQPAGSGRAPDNTHSLSGRAVPGPGVLQGWVPVPRPARITSRIAPWRPYLLCIRGGQGEVELFFIVYS